ncbi:MAG: hypothetical protein AAF576_03485 [Pseudomonadota bacterium]
MLTGGHAVYTLLSDDPRFTYYGRGVGNTIGVKRCNAPSEAVCNRLGLADCGAQILTIVDPAAPSGGTLTR